MIRRAFSLFLATACGLAGCDNRNNQPAPTTGKESDVHIRAPGVNVDVEHKGRGKGVNVDVEKRGG